MKTPKVLAITVATVAIIALIAGMVINGSPVTRRNIRFDIERVSELSSIANSINHAADSMDDFRLPETLKSGVDSQEFWYSFDQIVDPETGEEYEYQILSETRYKLCANFHFSSDTAESKGDRYGLSGHGDFWQHQAGHDCYEIDATDPISY